MFCNFGEILFFRGLFCLCRTLYSQLCGIGPYHRCTVNANSGRADVYELCLLPVLLSYCRSTSRMPASESVVVDRCLPMLTHFSGCTCSVSKNAP